MQDTPQTSNLQSTRTMPHIESDQAVMSMCKGHAPVTKYPPRRIRKHESQTTNKELAIQHYQ